MQGPTMTIDWQNLVVLAFLAAAGSYLARQVWATIARKKAGACGGCGSCPANATADSQQVVQLGSLTESAATTTSANRSIRTSG
jgi:hypothetical protein